MRIKCPFCGSRNTAKYIYGMPAYNEQMQKKLSDGEWVLGGCCISTFEVDGKQVDAMPEMHCNECKKDFGKPPLLVLRKTGEVEDYRDIVTSVYFSVGGFFQGHQDVTIARNDDGAAVKVVNIPTDIEKKEDRQITVKEWLLLLDKLYSRMYLHEWKKRYVDPDTLDGTQWELKIKLTGGRQRNYYGSNEYPPYWTELKNIFRKYAKIE